MKLVLIFLILVSIGGIIFAPLSVESYELVPSSLKPGQEGSIKIVLKNVQPSAAATVLKSVEDINIYYVAATGLEFKANPPLRVGTLEGGSTAIATFPIRVLPTARGGILAPSFTIKQREGTEQILTVPIRVVNPAILTLAVDKQTIQNTAILNMTITNDGGIAGKLTIRLNDTSRFSFIGTDQVFVGHVPNTTSVLINVDARNAAEGINIIPFIVIYDEEGGDTQTKLKEVSINVKKEKLDMVFTQTAPLVTSKEDVLSLTVRNTGRTLQDFRFVLTDGNIQAKESKEVKLGDFLTGEQREIRMNVFANVQPGVRNVGIKLKWIEEDVQKEEDDTIQMTVSSDADIGIFIDSKPVPLVVNGDHTLSVLVSNIGSYKIENVEVALQENDAIEIMNPQKTQYIGGLESDDFSTVQYKIRVKRIPAGSYPLEIHVRYKDQSGIWVEKGITTDLIIRASDDASRKESSTLLIYLLAAAVAAVAGYWLYRKRKKAMGKMS